MKTMEKMDLIADIDKIIGCNTDVTDDTHADLVDEILRYIEAKFNDIDLADVSQQSELLKAFLKWRLDKPHSDFQTQDYDIKEFLKAFNCG